MISELKEKIAKITARYEKEVEAKNETISNITKELKQSKTKHQESTLCMQNLEFKIKSKVLNFLNILSKVFIICGVSYKFLFAFLIFFKKNYIKFF